MCGRLEIVDRRDYHALISTAGHDRHSRRCHRTTIARRPATRTRGGQKEAQQSRTAAHDVSVLPLACGPVRWPALSRALLWTMLVQWKHSSYSGSGGGAGSRSTPKSTFPNVLGKRKRQIREKHSKTRPRYKTSTENPPPSAHPPRTNRRGSTERQQGIDGGLQPRLFLFDRCPHQPEINAEVIVRHRNWCSS